jgi:hypothetical protein
MQRRAGLIVSVIAVLSAPAGLGSTGNATHAKGERQGAIAGTLWMIGGPAPGHRVLRNTGIRVLAANRVVASTTTDGRGRFQSGGEIIQERAPIPGVGWFAAFTDTEGNRFGLMQANDSAA